MFGMGWQELLLVLIIALIFFGPNRLPDLGKSLGKAIASFKNALKDGEEEVRKNLEPPADPKA